jgi:hypothetical protein
MQAAIGYLRVGTQEQGRSGLELIEQFSTDVRHHPAVRTALTTSSAVPGRTCDRRVVASCPTILGQSDFGHSP